MTQLRNTNQILNASGQSNLALFFHQLLQSLIWKSGWEKIAIALLIVITPFLLFYNLDINPRPWHDEGDLLSVSQALAQSGVYAARNSGGYLTYGPIQSVGPTVVLPVALAFKLFGVGLVQGRAVASIYTILTLLAFFFTTKWLFGQRAAIFATFILLAAPGTRFLYTGRQVIGLVPAVGFFLAGWMAWISATKSKRLWMAVFSGLLLGCASVTKSQYLILIMGTLALVFLLDLLYYRQGTFKMTFIAGVAVLLCVSAWTGWQFLYYGQATYLADAEKLRELTRVAYSIDPHMILKNIRLLIGSETGFYLLLWGFLSLFYMGLLSLQKDHQGQSLAFLVLFTVIGLGFFVFFCINWLWYVFPPMVVSIIFVGKVLDDLLAAIIRATPKVVQELKDIFNSRMKVTVSSDSLVSFGALIAVASFCFWMVNNLENSISYYVLDKQGAVVNQWQWPAMLQLPPETAEYLTKNIGQDEVIETSEREFLILTSNTYHSPDQSILINVIPVIYFNKGTVNYSLGAEYFKQVRPTYLLLGFFGRIHQVYDMDFVEAYYERVTTIGSDIWDYEIFRLKKPLPQ